MKGESESLREKKIEDFLPALGGPTGEGANDSDAEAATARDLDAAHGLRETALSTLGIVDDLRTVQAGAQRNTVFFDKVAEGVVELPQIALHTELQTSPEARANPGQRMSVPGDTRQQGLAAVQHEFERLVGLPDHRQPVQSGTEGSLVHYRPGVGAEAIGAVRRAGTGWV